jgi:hypothetical protein
MVDVVTPAPGSIIPGYAGSIPSKLLLGSLVQLYRVPGTVLVTVIVNAAPEQTVWLDGETVTTGVALTVIDPVSDGLVQDDPVVEAV